MKPLDITDLRDDGCSDDLPDARHRFEQLDRLLLFITERNILFQCFDMIIEVINQRQVIFDRSPGSKAQYFFFEYFLQPFSSSDPKYLPGRCLQVVSGQHGMHPILALGSFLNQDLSMPHIQSQISGLRRCCIGGGQVFQSGQLCQDLGIDLICLDGYE